MSRTIFEGPQQKQFARRRTGGKRVVVNTTNKSSPFRKPHRYRPGTVALREVRRYQKTVDLLMRKAPFRRMCVTAIHAEKAEFRVAQAAIYAAQTLAESYMTRLMDKATRLAIFNKRKTVGRRELMFLIRLERGMFVFFSLPLLFFCSLQMAFAFVYLRCHSTGTEPDHLGQAKQKLSAKRKRTGHLVNGLVRFRASAPSAGKHDAAFDVSVSKRTALCFPTLLQISSN